MKLTRPQALVFLGFGIASTVAGLTWLAGPLVLVAAGVLTVAVAAFIVDIEE